MHSTSTTGVIVMELDLNGKQLDSQQVLKKKEHDANHFNNGGTRKLGLKRRSTAEHAPSTNTDTTDTPHNLTPDSGDDSYLHSGLGLSSEEYDSGLSGSPSNISDAMLHSASPNLVSPSFVSGDEFDKIDHELPASDDEVSSFEDDSKPSAESVNHQSINHYSETFNHRDMLLSPETIRRPLSPFVMPKTDVTIPMLDPQDFVVINDLMTIYLDKLSAVVAKSWQGDERAHAFKLQNELTELLARMNLKTATDAERIKAVGELCFLFDKEIYEMVGEKAEKLQKKSWFSAVQNILTDYFSQHKFILALAFQKLSEHGKIVSQNGELDFEQKNSHGINQSLTAIKNRLHSLSQQKNSTSIVHRLRHFFNNLYGFALAQLPGIFFYPVADTNIFTSHTAEFNAHALRLFSSANTRGNKVISDSVAYQKYIHEYTGIIKNSAIRQSCDLLKAAMQQQPELAAEFEFLHSQVEKFQQQIDLPRANAIDFENISKVSAFYLKSLKNFIEQFWKGDSRWQLLAERFQVELERFKKQIDNPAATTLSRLFAANEVLECLDRAIFIRVGTDLRELEKRTIVTELLQSMDLGSFNKISIKDIFSHFRKNGQQQIAGNMQNIINRLTPDEARDFVYYKNFDFIYFQLGGYIRKLWEFLMQKPLVEPYLQSIASKLLDNLATHRTSLGKMRKNHHKKMANLDFVKMNIQESINDVYNVVQAFDDAILTYEKIQCQRALKPMQIEAENIRDPGIRAVMVNQINATYERVIKGDRKEVFLDTLREKIHHSLREKMHEFMHAEFNRALPDVRLWSLTDENAFFTALSAEVFNLCGKSSCVEIISRLQTFIAGEVNHVTDFLKKALAHCKKDLVLANAILTTLQEEIDEFDEQKQDKIVNDALTQIQYLCVDAELDMWSSAIKQTFEIMNGYHNEDNLIRKFMYKNCNNPRDVNYLEGILLGLKRDDEDSIKGRLAEIEREYQHSCRRERHKTQAQDVPQQLDDQSAELPAADLLRRFVTPLYTSTLTTSMAATPSPVVSSKSPMSSSTTLLSLRKTRSNKTPELISQSPSLALHSRSCILPSSTGGHSPAPFFLSPPLSNRSSRHPAVVTNSEGKSRSIINLNNAAILPVARNGSPVSVVREIKREETSHRSHYENSHSISNGFIKPTPEAPSGISSLLYLRRSRSNGKEASIITPRSGGSSPESPTATRGPRKS